MFTWHLFDSLNLWPKIENKINSALHIGIKSGNVQMMFLKALFCSTLQISFFTGRHIGFPKYVT